MSASSGSWSPMSSRQPAEPDGLVGDFGVGPAHRRGRVVAADQPVHHGVQLYVLGVFVRCDLAGEQVVGVPDPGHCLGRRGGSECVGGAADLVGGGADHPVLVAESPGERGVRSAKPRAGRGWPQGPQRVEDHGYVDGFLQQRAPHRGQQPGCSHAHCRQGHPHPSQHALHRDPPGPTADRGYLTEAGQGG